MNLVRVLTRLFLCFCIETSPKSVPGGSANTPWFTNWQDNPLPESSDSSIFLPNMNLPRNNFQEHHRQKTQPEEIGRDKDICRKKAASIDLPKSMHDRRYSFANILSGSSNSVSDEDNIVPVKHTSSQGAREGRCKVVRMPRNYAFKTKESVSESCSVAVSKVQKDASRALTNNVTSVRRRLPLCTSASSIDHSMSPCAMRAVSFARGAAAVAASHERKSALKEVQSQVKSVCNKEGPNSSNISRIQSSNSEKSGPISADCSSSFQKAQEVQGRNHVYANACEYLRTTQIGTVDGRVPTSVISVKYLPNPTDYCRESLSEYTEASTLNTDDGSFAVVLLGP